MTKDFLIFEGILSMHDEKIRNLFDLRIFIHCEADIALSRRLIRDISDRGRDVKEVLNRYNKFVKKDFEKYVKPQMKNVHLIVPGGPNNDFAIEMVANNLRRIYKKKLKVDLGEKNQFFQNSQLIYSNQTNFSPSLLLRVDFPNESIAKLI